MVHTFGKYKQSKVKSTCCNIVCPPQKMSYAISFSKYTNKLVSEEYNALALPYFKFSCAVWASLEKGPCLFCSFLLFIIQLHLFSTVQRTQEKSTNKPQYLYSKKFGRDLRSACPAGFWNASFHSAAGCNSCTD